MQLSKQEWKLFRERLPQWQEAYMQHLVEEYQALLEKPGEASDKFWALDERIKADKKKPGVLLRVDKQTAVLDIVWFIHNGVIGMEALDGFSDETKDCVQFFLGRMKDQSC